jgi:hypothetical protein
MMKMMMIEEPGQNRSGSYEEEKVLTIPGLELRPLGHPARSQALYRLRYPASTRYWSTYKKYIFMYMLLEASLLLELFFSDGAYVV